MHTIHIKELFKNSKNYYNKSTTVCGWVRSIRNSKNFGFIVINDGTFFVPLQIVYDSSLDNLEQIRHLNVGAALIITGQFIATPDAKQPFELHAGSIRIEGASSPDYLLYSMDSAEKGFLWPPNRQQYSGAYCWALQLRNSRLD